MLAILGFAFGLFGLFFLTISPPFGLVAIVVALLLFAAQSNENRRAREQEKYEVEERRHQELLEATRQGANKPQ